MLDTISTYPAMCKHFNHRDMVVHLYWESCPLPNYCTFLCHPLYCCFVRVKSNKRMKQALACSCWSCSAVITSLWQAVWVRVVKNVSISGCATSKVTPLFPPLFCGWAWRDQVLDTVYVSLESLKAFRLCNLSDLKREILCLCLFTTDKCKFLKKKTKQKCSTSC